MAYGCTVASRQHHSTITTKLHNHFNLWWHFFDKMLFSSTRWEVGVLSWSTSVRMNTSFISISSQSQRQCWSKWNLLVYLDTTQKIDSIHTVLYRWKLLKRILNPFNLSIYRTLLETKITSIVNSSLACLWQCSMSSCHRVFRHTLFLPLFALIAIIVLNKPLTEIDSFSCDFVLFLVATCWKACAPTCMTCSAPSSFTSTI